MTLRELHQHGRAPQIYTERVWSLSTIPAGVDVSKDTLSQFPHNPLFTRSLLEVDLFPENCTERFHQAQRAGLPAVQHLHRQRRSASHRQGLQHDHDIAIRLPAHRDAVEEHILDQSATPCICSSYRCVPSAQSPITAHGVSSVNRCARFHPTCVSRVSEQAPRAEVPAIARRRGEVGRATFSSRVALRVSLDNCGAATSVPMDVARDGPAPNLDVYAIFHRGSDTGPLFPHGTQAGSPSARIPETVGGSA